MTRDRVVLVDGTALIYRAFFAIPNSFRTTSGVPTNATYGFARMFERLLGGRTPARAAVVFDAPGETFRDTLYPAYKAQRPPLPDLLRPQLPWIDRVVDAHGFRRLSLPGYEADDVIGTLTRRALEAGFEVHILSGDKDFAQLVGEHVRMVDPIKEVSYDPELVRKKWGVSPERFVDYLALVGDKADNIPGVPGVGPKTAKTLLESHGDLAGVLAAAPDVRGKTGERLIAHRDDALLSQRLATIDQDAPLDVTLDELALAPLERSRVDEVYRELEFFSLVSAPSAPPGAVDVEIDTLDDDEALAPRLLGGPLAFFVVLEEGAGGRRAARGIGLSTTPPCYVRLGSAAQGALAAWLADASRTKVTHGARDAAAALARAGLGLEGVTWDTGLASFLLDPTGHLPHTLDQVVRATLQRALPTATGDDARDACARAALIAECFEAQSPAIDTAEQRQVLEELSLPMSRVLAEMQLRGIRVDGAALGRLGAEFAARKAEIEGEIYEAAGREFNIGSTKQLGAVLFDELGLPVKKRTKTGYSTAAAVLEALAPQHPIAGLVLRQRALAKLINTYTRVLREAVDPETGRVHCVFQQTTGASGRLITTDPDLQRTPIRTEDGRRIREAFVPREGFRLISADWSQIELRLLAHVTGDPALRAAFEEGVDVHRRTAAQIYGIPADAVTREQRGVGKTVNFATLYGQGATALAASLGVPRREAKALIDRYFEVYAGVRAWIDQSVRGAYERGYVTTLGGRRRLIPELTSNNPTDRAYGERIAANTPIQGSAADLCKLAMLRIYAQLRAEGLTARMILQIHDELLVEAPPEEVEVASQIIREAMTQAMPLDVP